MTGCYGQDWASYQSPQPSTTGLSFVFVKCTEGLTYVNPRYGAQIAWARQNHLVVGHYHYPHMGNSAVTEAARFLSMARLMPYEMIALDWEGYDAANRGVPMADQIAYKNAWLSYVAGRMTPGGYRIGTYANVDYLDHDPHGEYGDFLWIADPGSPGATNIEHEWLFHQYGAKGVDRDYSNKTASELRAWANHTEDDMPLTPADAKTVWEYEHGVEPDMHAQLVAANQNSAATLAAVKALALKQPEIDYAKLAAALLAALKS